ncbi:MAG: hypothetical protein RMK91_06690 [Pseudanabaenaceae cyanobacterium SKYGB_i_bin29]|nr:hypothetical protein [Pseudanabaenaceae cyanobacterium SKYG29]MDW8421539.1 hypothetical protein [Pseudanabaenaceae cyanobacterium SKYGB_i_bin29]
MTTHYIELEISLAEPLTVAQIEEELKKEGEPLRWAVTKVDREEQKAIVEAVVTRG